MKNYLSLTKSPAVLLGVFGIFTSLSANSQKISEGGHHSLFLCQNTTTMSCGWGDIGQLGNINSYPWPIPTFQITAPATVTKVVCGDWHSLFLKSDSTVISCGFNNLGALGVGTNELMKTSPVNVIGLTGITDIAAGGGHSLFLKSNGTVWACGSNINGELGDGTTAPKNIPIQIASLSNVISIAAAGSCSYFVKSDGTVWACGFNIYGQLGDGTTINRLTPVQVTSLSNVVAVSASGVHTLFLKSNGTVWGAGLNSRGQLGIGYNSGQEITPVQAINLSGITHIAAGNDHSVYLKNDNTVWVCGYNYYGALGNGTTTDQSTPIQITTGVIHIAAGYTSTIFVKNNGTVWCCGENKYGLTGDAVITNSLVPVQASGLSGIIYAYAGKSFHSLFVKNDGSAWGFGRHQYGQLGGYTNPLQLSAVPVTSLTGVKAVCAGREHSLFLLNDSTVWGVGSNSFGEIGDSTGVDKTIQVVKVPGLTGIVAISTSEIHSLFLKSDSTVWACGYNGQGQLGDGTTVNRLAPVQVQGLSGIKAISAGAYYSLFLKSNGTVWACGNNGGGQFGNGLTTNSNIPVQSTSVSGITAISAGSNHSLFLKNDGTVWGSGQNNVGQIGTGNTTSSNIAIQSLMDSALAIVAAPGFSLFRKIDGTVWACGTNSSGQLGDSTIVNFTSTPNQVLGMTNVVEIDANASTSIFAKSDGSVWGCGTNRHGQLGDNTVIQRKSVVQVQNLCYAATSVNDPVTISSFLSCYPNPTSGIMTIQSTGGQSIEKVVIYSYDGRIVKSVSTNHTTIMNIDLSEFTAGIYLIDCFGESDRQQIKIIKN